MIKILFIGHDAYRAGAQILLLQFLKWLNVNRSDIQFEIMLGSGGTLLNEYKAIAPVNLYFRKSSKNKIRNRFNLFKFNCEW